MKLYEFGPSRGLRARWTLQELGVPFESVSINLQAGEQRKPDFMKLNPAAKLPVLVDGDLTLTESPAICLYLAEKHPEKKLIPTDPRDRAEFYRWVFFTTNELEQPLWRITRNRRLYPEEKRQPGDIAVATEEFLAAAKVAEDHMRSREFVVGTQVSIADFVLAYTLDWATIFKLLDGFPALNAYADRMYGRPSAPPRMAAIFAQAQRQAAN